MNKKITVQDVADTIDHSLLRPDITVEGLKEGCELAAKYHCGERHHHRFCRKSFP